MAQELFVNNFRTTLSGAIDNSQTTITLASATGLPALTGGNWFRLTLAQNSAESNWETVKVTGVAGTQLTVVRAFEGAARAWANGDKVEQRPTAGMLTDAHIGTNILTTATGNLAATNADAAITELEAEKLAISSTTVFTRGLLDDSDAPTARETLEISATNTPFTPVGGIAATDTQAAIAELDTEKLSTTATAVDSAKLGGVTPSPFTLTLIDEVGQAEWRNALALGTVATLDTGTALGQIATNQTALAAGQIPVVGTSGFTSSADFTYASGAISLIRSGGSPSLSTYRSDAAVNGTGLSSLSFQAKGDNLTNYTGVSLVASATGTWTSSARAASFTINVADGGTTFKTWTYASDGSVTNPGNVVIPNNSSYRAVVAGLGDSRAILSVDASNNVNIGPGSTGWGAITYIGAGTTANFRVNGVSGTFTTAATLSSTAVSIPLTTAATSTTTGALQVAGGTSCQGALYVGAGANAASIRTDNAYANLRVGVSAHHVGAYLRSPTDSSGWSRRFGFSNFADDANLGGFGALVFSGDALGYLYLGVDSTNTFLRASTSYVSVQATTAATSTTTGAFQVAGGGSFQGALWIGGLLNVAGTATFGSGMQNKITTITGNTTLDGTYHLVRCNSATPFTVTLPAAASHSGRCFKFKNVGAGTVTLDGNASETIDNALTQAILQNQGLEIYSNGTNYEIWGSF